MMMMMLMMLMLMMMMMIDDGDDDRMSKAPFPPDAKISSIGIHSENHELTLDVCNSWCHLRHL